MTIVKWIKNSFILHFLFDNQFIIRIVHNVHCFIGTVQFRLKHLSSCSTSETNILISVFIEMKTG